MKTKKDRNSKDKSEAERSAPFDGEGQIGSISTKAELKQFLVNLRDRVVEEQAAPIHILTALNHIMHTPTVHPLLDGESKEVARDLWLRLKQAGVNIHTPPMLFGEDGAIVP